MKVIVEDLAKREQNNLYIELCIIFQKKRIQFMYSI